MVAGGLHGTATEIACCKFCVTGSLAALVVSLGLTWLVGEVAKAARQYTRPELGVVLVHVLATATLGMAAAVERALRERAHGVWSRAVRALFETREHDADAECGSRPSIRLWI